MQLNMIVFIALFGLVGLISKSTAMELEHSTIKNLSMEFFGDSGSGSVFYFHYKTINGTEFLLDKKTPLELEKFEDQVVLKYNDQIIPFLGLPSSINRVKGLSIFNWFSQLDGQEFFGRAKRFVLIRDDSATAMNKLSFNCARTGRFSDFELEMLSSCFHRGELSIDQINFHADPPLELTSGHKIKDIKVENFKLMGQENIVTLSLVLDQGVKINLQAQGIGTVEEDLLIFEIKSIKAANKDMTQEVFNSIDGTQYKGLIIKVPFVYYHFKEGSLFDANEFFN